MENLTSPIAPFQISNEILADTNLQPPIMEIAGAGDHILVFPYPAQGHMIPLLDLTHLLALRGLTITILVTPRNLPLLNPLLSSHPSINTLVLPMPSHPLLPPGIENVKDLPAGGFTAMMSAISKLHDPIVDWFKNNPSPPVAILSDMFLGWTHPLACQLGIRRCVFAPSGAIAMSVIYSLWRDLPKRDDPTDDNFPIRFPRIPNSPVYPWWQISPIYRSYVEGDSSSEFLLDEFRADIASWALVINSFAELEGVYLDHLKDVLGHDRVWAVGPLLPPAGDIFGKFQRGGSSSDVGSKIFTWLETCKDRTVVYVCFGSQAVLRNDQMEELALGLEKSGARFILSVKAPTVGHVESEYGKIPSGFEDRVAGRGLILRGWAPQVAILSHRAVGAFLTHCGWNSVLESVVAGVPMLAWPMGADQFSNATLLVDELKVAVRVCEGDEAVPDSNELARLIAESVSDDKRVDRAQAVELLRKAAVKATEEGGSSFKDLGRLVDNLSQSS